MGQRTRRGRPAGHPDTAGDVLNVARRLFAESGYHVTSVRGVASEAGVDAAVVHYYFGTKSALFRAAVGLDDAAGVAPPPPTGQDDEARAAYICEHFTRVWECTALREQLLALLRSVGTHRESAEGLRGFTDGPLWNAHSAACSRSTELEKSLAAAQLIGVALLRYVVGVDALVQVSAAELASRLSPVVSFHLTPQDTPSSGRR
ncbi:TetR/AcrR family transcriptional regulator [Streptomyces sulphureus]|uniref:TetR/AcrR family transcriptional regulator n=1 Tax=Streptomyces sulphureus TaxID=47758 RepID=UPI00037C1D5F|nr:TetR/AcrR family transcriptional regulator [Streptomyces sulphureus]